MSEISMSKKVNNLVLFFDTETTGLPIFDKFSNTNPVWTPLNKQPYITQISALLFDSKTYQVIKFLNAYIRIPNLELITEELVQINGIKREKCELEGIPMEEALVQFFEMYKQSRCVIAHNIRFDRKMIIIEKQRHKAALLEKCPDIGTLFKYEADIEAIPVKPYCTMTTTIDYCNLYQVKNPNRKKAAKLAELYVILFRESPPEPLHNAVIDTLVGLRCYLKFAENKEIHFVKFRRMVENGLKLANI